MKDYIVLIKMLLNFPRLLMALLLKTHGNDKIANKKEKKKKRREEQENQCAERPSPTKFL